MLNEFMFFLLCILFAWIPKLVRLIAKTISLYLENKRLKRDLELNKNGS
jgi:hypothetical protein